MAGTSKPSGGPEGWLGDAEFQEELSRLGSTATPKQLERWRGEGLLPAVIQRPAYQADGRVAGSRVWHPPAAPRQVIAIERALAAKNRIQEAGELLWIAGFEVADHFWRQQIAQSDVTLRRVSRGLRLLNRDRDDAADTLGDRAGALDGMKGPLHKMVRRLEPMEQAAIVNVGVLVASGEFDVLDPHIDVEDGLSLHHALRRGLDFEGGTDDSVNGQRLSLGRTLQQVLWDISQSISDGSRESISDEEIELARNDVRNGLKMALCLYEAMSWIYGPNAFGLRMAAYFGRIASPQLYFGWIALFARLRRRSNSFFSSAEIAELARVAEMTWLIARYFRELQISTPKLADKVGPKALKSAFVDSHGAENLRKELVGCVFPEPQFRPWDQWKKLSKKTMSPGLLVMSIGAPSKLNLADIMRSGNAAANR